MRGLGLVALAACLTWQLAGAQKRDSCAQELAAAKAEVVRLKSAGQDLSPSAGVAKSAAILYGVSQHLLAQTTVDDKVIEVVSTHYGNAKALAKDAAGRFAEAEYDVFARRLTESQVGIYMAPVVGKARTVAQSAQPYVDQYVSPALGSAKAHAVAAVKKGTGKVMSEMWHLVQAFLAARLEWLYQIAAKAAPEHASSLPKDGVDRLLLLLMVLGAMYLTVKITFALCRFVLKLTCGTVRLAFRLTISLPLFLLRKSFVYSFWVATGFYCCGLCLRRKDGDAVAENGTKQKVQDSTKKKAKSKAEEEKETSKDNSKQVTVEELDVVLKAAKGKSKLEPTAKLLGTFAGKPIKDKGLPTNLQGKVLEKAALRKALGTYFKQPELKKMGINL